MTARPPSRPAVVLGAATLSVFALLAYTPLTAMAMRRLAVAEVAAPSPADAIVVLGAGASRDGVLSEQSQRRLLGGLLLYHRGLAPLLIVMGPGGDGERNEAEIRAHVARDLGVPARALIVEAEGLTTRHEAALAAQRLRHSGGRRILLVTGTLHMWRARAVFEKAGLEVVPAPVFEASFVSTRPDARLALARILAMEVLARGYYRLAGYI